jgi:hypothetical protein
MNPATGDCRGVFRGVAHGASKGYRLPIMRRFLPLAFTLLLGPCTSHAADENALFTVDVRLQATAQDHVDVRIECGAPDDALQVELSIPAGGSRTFTVPVPPEREIACELTAAALPGQVLRYVGDGGSTFDLDANNCRFTGVRAGHANFCQIRVQSRETSLTVFKHWIGTSDPQADSRVFLDCGPDAVFDPLEINERRPGSWRFEIQTAEGLRCSVDEEAQESFIPDVSDCSDLLIRAGAREECTVVNTKVVKMIEMFNRYGLALMIVLFMIVGGLAARRMV